MIKFFSLSYRESKSSKGIGSVLPILLLAVFSFSFQTTVLAQNVPVYASYEPEEFGDGDEISIQVKLGDENNQIYFAQAIQFKISYELFEINPESEIEQKAGYLSWFGGDGNYSGTQYVDHATKQIVVNMFRTNGEPMSGFGYTTRLRGIIVEMEEIMGKTNLQPGAIEVAIMEDVKTRLGINWSLSNESDQILLRNSGEAEIEEVKVFNLAGQVVAEGLGANGQISTSQLSPQAYVLHVRTNQGSFSEKILLK
ncbi:MAG: T9SS type A sorting domain-containing protein [Bacteroidota bacterium]